MNLCTANKYPAWINETGRLFIRADPADHTGAYYAFLAPLVCMCRIAFLVCLAGEAVNQLTPLANIGGEPLKAYLLKRETPTSLGLASVVINKTAQGITGLLFTAAGLGLVVLDWDLAQAMPVPVQIGLGSLLSIGAVLIWMLYRTQQRMFSSVLSFLRRLGLRFDFIESRMAKAERIDSNISRFYREHKARFVLAMLFHAAGWLLGACETFVILQALGPETSFGVAFLITSLTVIINGLFFMPSNIGVLEGGQVFLFMTLGLNPAMGLSLGIAKRMRKVIWILVGWLLLTRLSRDMDAASRAAGGLREGDDSDRPLVAGWRYR